MRKIKVFGGNDYYWSPDTGFLTWYPTRRKKIKNLFHRSFKRLKEILEKIN